MGDDSAGSRFDALCMPVIALLLRGLAWLAASAVLALALVTPGSPVSLVKVSVGESSLSITGSIDHLDTGRPAVLHLTLRSAADAGVAVHALTAAVMSARGCSASALHIRPWLGVITVPAHGTASVSLRAVLAADATCPGASWQLRYTAT
jgi:hypothetical protein